MSFSTLTFTGAASGGTGMQSTAGTFTVQVTGNDDGSVTGTWSYSGNYEDTGFYGTSGTVNLSGTVSGTGGMGGPWSLALAGTNVIPDALTLSYGGGQYTLAGGGGFGIDYSINLGYDGLYTYHDRFDFAANIVMPGNAPGGAAPTDGPDMVVGTPGPDTINALGGNDTVIGGDGNDTITGGAGDDSIDGGAGIDTAVFSDIRANYTITNQGNGLFTVTHNVPNGDGTDTLVNVERLVFADEKVAIDLNGDGGEAYRLYQAAFDRVPDLGGLGYQMNALDTGLTLEQVASNFMASPEFQSRYGTNIDDTTFVTLLYQNVLHRAPDEGGLQYHLNELLTQSRADVLTHFSESPENQANVMGQIEDGMVFVF